MPSYYKAAAPSRIEIAFPTYEFERAYLRELIAGGLGEFAYRNDLPGALAPDVTGPQAPAASGTSGTTVGMPPAPAGTRRRRQDSVVTIEALKRRGMRPMLFSVNKFDPIDRCIEVSGLDSTRVTRSIDRRLIEINGEGAYNGHVPVTAINSVIGLIVADAARARTRRPVQREVLQRRQRRLDGPRHQPSVVQRASRTRPCCGTRCRTTG